MSCHIIDGEGNFAPLPAFQEGICNPASLEAYQKKKKYWVVGVFGGQSSGKSTLLNALFQTQFRVMNEDDGRTQTTRGLWLASSKANPNVFAMDVEGTDGQERFDNQVFERRSSLFALATCDVLVINMWTSEVGRFNGANLSVLRCIFELNLKLFPKATAKTKLLFVLRDHTTGTLEKHSDVVKEGLKKVWEGVYRDDKSKGIEDCFDLKFFSFPHYQLQRDKFDEKMVELVQWFTPASPETILGEKDTAREDVPLQGLYQYMSTCWETICQNKDIDIPTQKELLAKHRCMEISEEAMKEVKAKLEEWKSQIVKEKTYIKGLGDLVTALAIRKQTEMQEEANLYAKRIVEDQAEALKNAIFKESEPVLGLQVDLVLAGQVQKNEEAVYVAVDKALREGGGPAKTWPAIRDALSAQKESLRSFLQSKVVEGSLDNATHDVAEKKLLTAMKDAVLGRLKVISQDIHKHMGSAFEYALHHHADGTNRFFNSTGVLTSTAASVKAVGFEYLNSVSVYRLDDPSLDSGLVLTKSGAQDVAFNKVPREGVTVVIESSAAQRAYDLYLQQTDFTVQLIQKSIEMSSTRIPPWFWGLFLFFALDDIWVVVTTPWLMILIAFVSYFFFREIIKQQVIGFITDPPAWFTYVEMFLEANLPGIANELRSRRAAFSKKVGDSPLPDVENKKLDTKKSPLENNKRTGDSPLEENGKKTT